MDETMNTGVEVTTEVSGAEEVTQEITIEETSSGPSKGFIALVVSGIAAVAVGATVAIKRHKKKKAAAQADDEFFEDDFDDDLEDEEEPVTVEAEVVSKEKSEEKPAEEKK